MAKTTWKQVVYDTADAYREATGTTDKIPVGELADRVRQGGGGKEDLDAELTLQETLLAEQVELLEGKAVYDVQEITLDPVPEGSVHEFYDFVASKVTLNPFQGNTGLYVWKKYGKGKTDKNLPAGYVQLDYIKSDGTQYINAGFKPNQNTRLVFDVEIEKLGSSTTFIFGARNNGAVAQFRMLCMNSTTFRSCYGTESKDVTVDSVLGRRRFELNKNVFSIDGKTVTTHTAQTFQANFDLTLFTTNDNGTVDANMMAGKAFSAQAYDGNSLIKDFVPCVCENGVGLYDVVGNVFHGGVGTNFALDAEFEYVVSFDSTAYPNGGEQDGYWYELTEEGFDFTDILGYTRCSVTTFTFSSRTAVNNALTHPFVGDIPKFAMIVAKSLVSTNSDLYLAVGLKNTDSNNGVINVTQQFVYSSSEEQKVGRNGVQFGVNRNATGNIFLDSNSIYYAAGVEYYLIVAL